MKLGVVFFTLRLDLVTPLKTLPFAGISNTLGVSMRRVVQGR